MENSIQLTIESLKIQYEQISVESVDQLIQLYSPDARFKDPFNLVFGRDAIRDIFLKMFEQVDSPQFVIREVLQQESSACLLWEFKFKFKCWDTSEKSLTGVSWLQFDHTNLVSSHTDYWDPAEGIYEHLPLIGSLMRGLKKLA
ncbi:nuclear transport factor 2 family protein [Polynucleobacter rarus]|uniref:nuclear transport factor 2 family protein n=1 Tax=Polynucleobacter rarus TaxID=556055 RepID=UPI00131F0CBA|nr:nuclear transport factor 2 family protein [Polynucleobacter rarus]